jgi:phosphatidylglycerol:prolipoprotein diacylglycerol transferase
MEALGEPARTLGAALGYACAYVVGLALFAMMARRRNIATPGVWIIMQAGLLGGLAFAGLTQVLFAATPGKTLLGGIAGGYLCVALAKRHLRITRPTGDLWAVALAGGEAVGRIGCFVGGCCFGKAAGVAWAVHDHGAWRHPTQLYLAAAAGCVLVLLLALDRYRLPENALFYIQGVLFCALRLAIEFYRDGAPAFGGLTLAQWACIAGLGFFGWRLAGTVSPLLARPIGVRSRVASATSIV